MVIQVFSRQASHLSFVRFDIIMSSPHNTCDLDPLPTTLLKACLDTLLYPITHNVNVSLHCGLFLGDFRQAQVSPLLKESTFHKKPKQL